MWFDSWRDLVSVVLVGIAACASIVLVLRGIGKRTLAQLNAFDLVVTVALGSVLATILLSPDVSWSEGPWASKTCTTARTPPVDEQFRLVDSVPPTWHGLDSGGRGIRTHETLVKRSTVFKTVRCTAPDLLVFPAAAVQGHCSGTTPGHPATRGAAVARAATADTSTAVSR